MSYLDLLKAKKSETRHPTLLTKPTKDPSVSFVSALGCHVLENTPGVVSHDAGVTQEEQSSDICAADMPSTIAYCAAEYIPCDPTPTDGPLRQCQACPHCWYVACGCGTASWQPAACWRVDGTGVVVWTCKGCGVRYGADREQSQAQPAVVSPATPRVAALEPPAVSWRCYCCKGTRRWRSSYGVLICGTCHPPGAMALGDEWLEDGGGLP